MEESACLLSSACGLYHTRLLLFADYEAFTSPESIGAHFHCSGFPPSSKLCSGSVWSFNKQDHPVEINLRWPFRLVDGASCGPRGVARGTPAACLADSVAPT